jgi:Protein of unknown function (DUF4238)
LPVFYQKRFSDEEGVWLYDLETKVGKRLPPKAVLAIEDFNTIDAGQGPIDDVEKGLGRIDSEGATALRRIEEGFWPAFGEVRQALSMFMAFQVTRGPGFRDQMDDFAHEVGSLMMKVKASRPQGVKRDLRERLGRDPTENEMAAELKLLKNFGEKYRIRQTRDSHVHTMLGVQRSGEIAEILFRRTWTLEVSATLEFITSDSPLTLWSPDVGPFHGIGVATAEEVRFPLNSRQCLVMRHPWMPAPDVEDVSVQRVLEINARTLLHSRRFAVSKSEISDVPDRIPKKLGIEVLSGRV